MNAYFENNIEEIEQIISRSHKDKNTSIFRIQKAKKLELGSFNSRIMKSSITTLYGVNMHILSREGYLIYGSSDRMHLPDVITRLYQSLDNLLRANNGHKVHRNIVIDSLPKDEVSHIQNFDLGEWDLEYPREILQKAYSSLAEDIRSEANITLQISGDYSLWSVSNSLGGKAEFDELMAYLTCEVSLKANPERKLCFSKLISASDLRNKDFDLEDTIKKITEDYLFLSKSSRFEKVNFEKIDPEIVLFDETLSVSCLYNLLYSDADNLESLQINCKEDRSSKIDHNLIDELIDKSGFEIPEIIDIKSGKAQNCQKVFDYKDDSELTPANNILTRLSTFCEYPVSEFRNLSFSGKSINTEIDLTDSGIEDLIEKVKKLFGVKKVLYLAGEKGSNLNSNRSGLLPAISIYSNESTTYEANVSSFELDNIQNIEFVGSAISSLFITGKHYPSLVTSPGLMVVVVKVPKK